MGLTLSQTKRNNVSGTKVTSYVTVGFDNEYPSGGEPFDATTYVGNPDEVRVTNDSVMGYVVRYDATNKKLKVFEVGASDQTPTADIAATALTECAAATNLELITVDLVIMGSRA